MNDLKKFSIAVVILTITVGVVISLFTHWPTSVLGWLNLLIGWPLIVLFATGITNIHVSARIRKHLAPDWFYCHLGSSLLFLILGFAPSEFPFLTPALLACLFALNLHLQGRLSSLQLDLLGNLVGVTISLEVWLSVGLAAKFGSLAIAGLNVAWWIVAVFLSYILDKVHPRRRSTVS